MNNDRRALGEPPNQLTARPKTKTLMTPTKLPDARHYRPNDKEPYWTKKQKEIIDSIKEADKEKQL